MTTREKLVYIYGIIGILTAGYEANSLTNREFAPATAAAMGISAGALWPVAISWALFDSLNKGPKKVCTSAHSHDPNGPVCVWSTVDGPGK
jgi:hypothetical protein